MSPRSATSSPPSDRGTFMGNRGVLHDAEGRIRRAWQLRRWIVCVLEFRGRKRRVMTPGRYTELFFLDEATALAAGHRPCAECRHARFLDFCNAWGLAHRDGETSARPTAPEIDDRLHAERVAPDRSNSPSRRRWTICRTAYSWPCRRGERRLTWCGATTCSPGRREATVNDGGDRRVRKFEVLTPPSTVAAIRAGYAPEVHPSAVALA